MTVEQLAALGIGAFAFMVLGAAFTVLRSLRQISRRPKPKRLRRFISSPESASLVAQGVVREVAAKHNTAAARSRAARQLDRELEQPLTAAREYYQRRVDPSQKPFFSEAVDLIILGIEPVKSEPPARE